MNRTTVVFEEWALLIRRLAKPHLAAGPVNIFGLERARRHPDKFCGTFEVGFGQIDEAFLIAAIDAPGLAGKT